MVQDALKALLGARHGVPERAWWSWFTTALTTRERERSRNNLRALERSGEVAYEVVLCLTPPGAAQEQQVAAEQRAALADMVGALVPCEREIVRLHACEDVPMSEVAQRQRISEKAAWNRWTLATARLVSAGKRWRARDSFELLAAAVLLFLLFVRRLWAGRGRRAAGPAIVFAAASLCCCGDTPSGALEVVSDEPLARDALPAAPWAFSAAWAERERESGSGSAVASESSPDHDSARSPSAVPAVVPRADSTRPRAATVAVPPPDHALLLKARAALTLGDLTAAGEALRLYEVEHPDPTHNDMHRELRVELALARVDNRSPVR